MNDEPGKIPIPDPTLLTTAALEREIRHLRELLEDADAQLAARITLEIEGLRRQLAEADLRYQERFETQREAVAKAEQAADKRADEVSRRVDDVKDGTARELSLIQAQVSAITGRFAGGAAMWALVSGVLLLLAAVITTVLALTN